MRYRICIRGYVGPSVRPSVHRSHTSWNHAKVPFLTKTSISTNENASYAVYPALFYKRWIACRKSWTESGKNFVIGWKDVRNAGSRFRRSSRWYWLYWHHVFSSSAVVAIFGCCFLFFRGSLILNIGCFLKRFSKSGKKKCKKKWRWPSRKMKIWYKYNNNEVFISA